MSAESINLFHSGLEKALERLGKQNIELKECQYEAVKAVVVDRKDTFCVLPTGYGKSLIYNQLLPFVFDAYLGRENTNSTGNSVIVISPLNALMVDQITKLKKHMDVSVLKASREATPPKHSMRSERGSIYHQIAHPSQIIFAHPEALLEDKKIFQNILKSKSYQDSVKAIVIDEAHLVEEWKSFRPCYAKIGMLTSIFPKIPFLAMTATATLQMKKDITTSLGLIDPKHIEISPDRPNIFFSSLPRPDRGDDKLQPILTPLIAELKVKRIIHIGVPRTIEEYFQEAGRCGRDGLPASSTIYYNSYDLASSRNISPHMKELVTVADKCKREIILDYFGYKVANWIKPEHTCCDFHQQKCSCDDCVLSSAAELLENANSGVLDPSVINDPDYMEAVEERSLSLTTEQKDLLKGYLLNYKQFLHGYGKSCVGSVGLSTGLIWSLLTQLLLMLVS
ncbi:ATP-dependent DNA helicase Q1 [Paramuricea clavata]|uniref:ATP-dependent DNA helicase Q1 n=1 Tax=Paramuricea clavata TaxID=317549 RepID=A0A7D9DAJ9_PARCT|nr:ATP-dependent DNA helicase Q1 [Paramuricea clavata]